MGNGVTSNGLTSNLIRNFQLLIVNSFLRFDFLASGEQEEHHGFRFCWFWGSPQTLLGRDALKASKIHSKFILRQKNIISIALTVFHTSLLSGKKIGKHSGMA